MFTYQFLLQNGGFGVHLSQKVYRATLQKKVVGLHLLGKFCSIAIVYALLARSNLPI